MYHKFLLCIAILIQHLHGSLQITDREYASMPTLFHLDDYDHCMQLQDEFLYCNIEFALTPINVSDAPAEWKIIEEVNKWRNSYRHDIIRHGLCIPESCPEAKGDPIKDLDQIRLKLQECYNRKYAERRLKGEVIDIRCENQQSPYPMGFYEYLFKIVMGCYLVFVIFATFYDGCASYKPKEEYEKIITTPTGRFLSSFSLAKNWKRLKTVNYDDPDIRALSSIQGIRFYNMILVISTHTFMLNMGGPVSNPLFVEMMDQKFLSILFENGGYVVQTFFMTSAWLMMYQFLMNFDGKEIPGKVLIWAFIHRFLRLTPAFAVVLFYHATLLPHEARGPSWDYIVGDEYRRCRHHGWLNLLYLNNYAHKLEMCMPHTWYMAVDTQFFFLGLVILWYTWNNIKRFFTVTVGLIVLHVAILFYLIYSNDWEFTFRALPEDLYFSRVIRNPQWHQILASNYGHLPGLPVGLIFGYLYYKNRGKKLFTKKIHLVIYWVICWGCGLGIIVIPGSFIHYCPLYKHVALYDALYGCISRTIFILSIGVTIFGMTQGEAWFQRWVCEWKPTYILGRLTYSAYLVHMIFLRIRGGQKRVPQYLSDYLLFSDIIGDIAVSFLGGLLLTLFVELPMSDLQKLLLPANEKSKDISLNKPLVKDKKIN